MDRTRSLEPVHSVAGMVPANETNIRILAVLSFELDPYTLPGEELAETPERLRLAEEAVEKAARDPRAAS
jgi:hypothetical protein